MTNSSIPESERRARGQEQVKVRLTTEQLDRLRKRHGKPGDSAAMVVRRAAGLVEEQKRKASR